MKIPLALGWGQKGNGGERGMAEGTYVVNGGTLFYSRKFSGKTYCRGKLDFGSFKETTRERESSSR